MSVKVTSMAQARPAKQQRTRNIHGTFKGKIELKKYSQEEYYSMLKAEQQQLYELWKMARLITGKKIPKCRRALEARVASLEVKKASAIRAHSQMKSPKQ